jgi:hypothetical protein
VERKPAAGVLAINKRAIYITQIPPTDWGE